jgi:hypothetical protein
MAEVRSIDLDVNIAHNVYRCLLRATLSGEATNPCEAFYALALIQCDAVRPTVEVANAEQLDHCRLVNQNVRSGEVSG